MLIVFNEKHFPFLTYFHPVSLFTLSHSSLTGLVTFLFVHHGILPINFLDI